MLEARLSAYLLRVRTLECSVWQHGDTRVDAPNVKLIIAARTIDLSQLQLNMSKALLAFGYINKPRLAEHQQMDGSARHLEVLNKTEVVILTKKMIPRSLQPRVSDAMVETKRVEKYFRGMIDTK